MNQIKNILVPTDFSDGSIHTLDYAAGLAKSMNAKLHIIHVIEPIILSFEIVVTNYGLDELPNELEALAEKGIEKIETMLGGLGVEFTSQILHGKAYVEILNYAAGNAIDMICISTHGVGNLESLLFGSNTEKVLRKAECPVLTIRYKA